ncbi:MAG: toxin-antitoxin system YwqK family antitoxin [Myxococcaceae bacterium]|nr:toxin-antitoxin system YwqK family antitoxin [Myxococcaceae bacterium]
MLLKKWTKVFGTLAIVTMAPAALASSPIKLNCPAGTVQKGGSDATHDIAACVKQGDDFKPHGATVFFYPSGAKQAEGPSENGFRTGLWTFYDEKGNKTGTAMFKRSNFHGEVVELHPNGKVRKVAQYVDGLREGTAKEFSADGRLVKQTEYRNNREVAAK